ncbi:hypothetical protein [Selenomonas ruminantium]|uniref:hypothetical protein n=1 Tax=Selenomonas ruminantium TaxID=971 RepID=UPI0026F18E72|nr:hypothetical protein [Selenomonas ruminantium]
MVVVSAGAGVVSVGLFCWLAGGAGAGTVIVEGVGAGGVALVAVGAVLALSCGWLGVVFAGGLLSVFSSVAAGGVGLVGGCWTG